MDDDIPAIGPGVPITAPLSVEMATVHRPDDFRAHGRRAERAPVDRLPPHSEEAEMSILGSVFLEPQCLNECIERLTAGSKTFYCLNHQVIYDVFVEMHGNREAIDVITVMERLKSKGQIEAVGGIAFLGSLPDKSPSAANLPTYLDIVIEAFHKRRLISTCTDIVNDVYEHRGDVETLFDAAESEVLSIRRERAAGGDQAEAKTLIHGTINTLEQLHANKGQLMGLGTGFPDLDKMTYGLKGGEMIVIAARPSIGKTSLAMNIAEYVAVDCKIPTGVFSLEMSKESLMLRMACARARCNLRNFQEGQFSDRDFPKLTNAANQIRNAPLVINDRGGLSILQWRALAFRMHQQYGIKLFVLDYLQLLRSTSRKAESNRQVEIAEVSGGVKQLAKDLNVPVIVLAQLNRDLEKRKSGMPQMSDLKESGAIEQDADLLGLLYKPNAKDDDEDAPYEQEAVAVNMNIAKQRNGPTGIVNLTFLKSYTRFESAAKIRAEDVPPTQTTTTRYPD